MGLVQLLKQWLGFQDGTGVGSAEGYQGGEGFNSMCFLRRDVEELGLVSLVKSRLGADVAGTLKYLKGRHEGDEAQLLLVVPESVRTVRDHKLQLEGLYWILRKNSSAWA